MTDRLTVRRRASPWAGRLRVRYIAQSNQGQAAARNTGLAYATGTWVSFPDPDDFFAKDYLEKVDHEVARARALPLSMISCNTIFFKEGKRREENSHPLRHRFAAPRTILPASNLGDHMQLATNATWLRRELIEANALRFDPRVFPSFEDGHFANRFLLLNPETEVAFLKSPVYFYRKRISGDSTLDAAKLMPAWYVDNLRYGQLDILRRAKAATGEVPRFIQRGPMSRQRLLEAGCPTSPIASRSIRSVFSISGSVHAGP